ncbi:PTS sugar transporter subunit IIB [Enemella sp. A6]|uniref:PTS sugar transporter subunit IIB n=1 Tax=Enemella sp. A6 TaxID=3440152 RepID=UPI003EBEFF4D
MKKIVVACAGAVLTSMIAADRITDLCRKAGIAADVQRCTVDELPTVSQGADLIVSTVRVGDDYGAPVVYGAPFITGQGVAGTEAEVLAALS